MSHTSFDEWFDAMYPESNSTNINLRIMTKEIARQAYDAGKSETKVEWIPSSLVSAEEQRKKESDTWHDRNYPL